MCRPTAAQHALPLWLLSSAILLVPAHAARLHRDWHELRSPHFTLRTDLDREQADLAIRQLESARAAILAAAWQVKPTSLADHAEVIVLEDELLFEDLFGKRVLGLFDPASFPPTLILTGTPDRWERRPVQSAAIGTRSTLKHELTHHLSHFFAGRQPRWLSEGLAQFAETLELSEDGKRATLGKPKLDAIQAYARNRSLGVEDALKWSGLEENETRTGGLYALSWLIVHWAFNTRADALADYQARLAKGEDAKLAWFRSFKGLAPAEANRLIHAYLQHGDYREFVVDIDAPSENPAHRLLKEGEARVVLARVALTAFRLNPARSDFKQQAQEHIDAARRRDPTLPDVAALALVSLEPDERARRARDVTEKHPRDPRAWRLLGDVLPDVEAKSAERITAYERAVALAPEDALALNGLAWLLARKGEFAAAKPRIERAVEVSGSIPGILDTYAVVLAGLGACREAIAMEGRALEVLSESRPTGMKKELQGRRDRWERALAAGARCKAFEDAPVAPPE